MTRTTLPCGTTSGNAAMHSSTVANQRSSPAPVEIVAAELAHRDQMHAGGGAVFADGAMKGVGTGAELVHVAEDGDRGAALGEAHQMVDRGRHGKGVGVVGVVEQEAAAGKVGDGAAQVAEGDLRGAGLGLVEPEAQFHEGGQRRQRRAGSDHR